jgi:hypothetical protein
MFFLEKSNIFAKIGLFWRLKVGAIFRISAVSAKHLFPESTTWFGRQTINPRRIQTRTRESGYPEFMWFGTLNRNRSSPRINIFRIFMAS